MSDHTAIDPTEPAMSACIELVIKPKPRDLGEFTVRRALPSPERRTVGPFIFFDHMGPAEFPPDEGIQVRPHPHIGLATVTYLFEGEIIHRDSLGYVQPIQAGAVNLMTAGRGIVHSERAGEDLKTTSRLHGIQTWMALPTEEEECDPAFVHYPANELPAFEHEGIAVRVIIGEAWGHRSPVAAQAPTLYLECKMSRGAVLTLPTDHDETAAYVVSGEVRVDGQQLSGGLMAVACPGKAVRLEAAEESHVMVIGGANLGERHIWWNLVSSSKERIEQAKQDWQQNRFDPVPGEDEFIPLPSK
jgi:redox-sensitive bicupin YhaK (pirin superfamily)